MIRRLALPLLLALAAPGLAAPAGFTIAGEAFPQADILDARTVPDGSGSAALLITFQPKGAAHLKALSAAHVGKPMAVALDGVALAEAKASAPIDDGQIQLSGNFGSFDEATPVVKKAKPSAVVPAAKPKKLALPTGPETTGSVNEPANLETIGTDDVLAMQQKLVALGLLDGKADGLFGPRTAKAIKAYEASVGRTPRNCS